MTNQKQKFVLSTVLMTILAFCGCNNSNTPAQPLGPCGDVSCVVGITGQQFVSELVQLAQDGKINPAYANSRFVKLSPVQNGTVIIWDGKYQAYVLLNGTNELLNVTYENGISYTGDSQFFGPYGYASSNISLTLVAPIGIGADGAEQYEATNGVIYDQNQQTRDTDLQQANMQTVERVRTAAALSSGFQMDYGVALQVTELSERIRAMNAQNVITAEDSAAIMSGMTKITGITTDDVNQVVSSEMQGNHEALNLLLAKVSKNLGMPSGALRDRLLPALGMNLD